MNDPSTLRVPVYVSPFPITKVSELPWWVIVAVRATGRDATGGDLVDHEGAVDVQLGTVAQSWAWWLRMTARWVGCVGVFAAGGSDRPVEELP